MASDSINSDNPDGSKRVAIISPVSSYESSLSTSKQTFSTSAHPVIGSQRHDGSNSPGGKFKTFVKNTFGPPSDTDQLGAHSPSKRGLVPKNGEGFKWYHLFI